LSLAEYTVKIPRYIAFLDLPAPFRRGFSRMA
jgi:hypothetical protein